MDADPNRPGRAKPARRRRHVTLWCGACGRSRAFTCEQVSGFIDAGWPECCGRTMGLGHPSPPAEAERPAG